MINGDYILVVAPENYPYKKYRDRYCYEHILNYWLEYGEIPEGNQIHHKDENKHNNNPNNLESLSAYDHKYIHAKTGVTMVILKCPSCGKVFEKRKGHTHLTKSRKSVYTACSRKCSGYFSHLSNVEQQKRISEMLVREFTT